MNISNIKVYELEESIIASGYPMTLDIDSCTVDYKRGSNLGSVEAGSGHDNFLINWALLPLQITALYMTCANK